MSSLVEKIYINILESEPEDLRMHKGLQNPKIMSDWGDDYFYPNCYSKFLSIAFYLSKLFLATLYAAFSRKQPVGCAGPELPMLLWSPPSPPNTKSGCEVIHTGRKLSVFFMSSKSAHPEWNNRTVLCRVGGSEMMRITGTNSHCRRKLLHSSIF